MITIPLQFQNSAAKFYDALHAMVQGPRIRPLAGEALHLQILQYPSTEDRVALFRFWWDYTQSKADGPNDKRVSYTKMLIKDALEPLCRDVLSHCGVEAFDGFQDFWDVDGFCAALEYEHWSGAAYILEHAIRTDSDVVLSDHRHLVVAETLNTALEKFGCALTGSIENKKQLVAQELHNRITQATLNKAIENIELRNTGLRKI